MKRVVLTVGVVVAIHFALLLSTTKDAPGNAPSTSVVASSGPASPAATAPPMAPAIAARPVSNPALAQAFLNRWSGVAVQGYGTVDKVLSDDADGSRHQRFIVDVGNGQTIMIAHNIDIAPRIPGIQEGETLEFSGVYEWKEQGGTIHWTHHDPGRRKQGGWLRYRGRVYQ